MRTVSALIEAKASIESAFVAAGILNGLTLTPEEIEAATTPIFWFINVLSKDASEKEIYITYNIVNAPVIAYGDGNIQGFRITAQIFFFTRHPNIDTILSEVNEKFEANHWTFEFDSFSRDSGNQLFVYSFFARAEVF